MSGRTEDSSFRIAGARRRLHFANFIWCWRPRFAGLEPFLTEFGQHTLVRQNHLITRTRSQRKAAKVHELARRVKLQMQMTMNWVFMTCMIASSASETQELWSHATATSMSTIAVDKASEERGRARSSTTSSTVERRGIRKPHQQLSQDRQLRDEAFHERSRTDRHHGARVAVHKETRKNSNTASSVTQRYNLHAETTSVASTR